MEISKTKPKVSVIMATYNDPLDYLRLSIESIIRQTYKNWEFLIVDDSTEKTVMEAIDDYAAEDGRIRVIRGSHKYGFVKSLNIGLEKANGEYVARMDSDDISKERRLEEQVKFLKENSDVDIIGADIEIIDERGKKTGQRKYESSIEKIKKHAFIRNPLAHPAVMCRKKTLSNLKGYDDNFKMAEDYELWLRALNAGMHISNVSEILLSYRMGTDYYKKRGKENWHYNFLAKKKNFYWSFYNFIGILMALVMYYMPSFIISILYELDRKKGEYL